MPNTSSEEGAKMRQVYLASLKTYEVCNLLMNLLNKNVDIMTDLEYKQHEEDRAAIKQELKNRKDNLTIIINARN